MILYEQMIALGYHLLVGQIFGFFYSFLSLCCLSFSTFLRLIVYTVFSMCATLLFYYGLYKINGGVTHVYLLVIVLIGIYLYYHFFYECFLPFFYIVKKFFRPIKKKYYFEKTRLCAIINKRRDKRRRKANKNERNKSEKKSQ